MSPLAAPEAPEECQQAPAADGKERMDEEKDRKGFSGVLSDLRSWIARRLPVEPPLQ